MAEQNSAISCGGSGFLSAELVGREAQHREAATAVLLVQGLQLAVLRCQTAAAGDIDHQGGLAAGKLAEGGLSTVEGRHGKFGQAVHRGLLASLETTVPCDDNARQEVSLPTTRNQRHAAWKGQALAEESFAGKCESAVVVELQGIEPWTSSMRTKRATNCATAPGRGLHREPSTTIAAGQRPRGHRPTRSGRPKMITRPGTNHRTAPARCGTRRSPRPPRSPRRSRPR